jgi:hypothetical protein
MERFRVLARFMHKTARYCVLEGNPLMSALEESRRFTLFSCPNLSEMPRARARDSWDEHTDIGVIQKGQ